MKAIHSTTTDSAMKSNVPAKHITTNSSSLMNFNDKRYYSKFDIHDEKRQLEQLEAFAGDDVVAEFSQERKEETVEQVDTLLPGVLLQ